MARMAPLAPLTPTTRRFFSVDSMVSFRGKASSRALAGPGGRSS